MLSIKILSLSALCVAMTVITIVMHISRTRRDPGIPAYKPASAVLLTELGKLAMSLGLAYSEVKQLIAGERGSGGQIETRTGEEKQALLADAATHDQDYDHNEEPSQVSEGNKSYPQRSADLQAFGGQSSVNHLLSDREVGNYKITFMEILYRMREETFGGDWLKLSIPAMLFTGQSNLAYYASSNLTVPVFQITYQLKIPATAVCSVLMLKRTLSAMQWASIVLLSVGVGIVQIASQATGEKSASLSSSSLGEGFNSGLNGTTDLLLDTRALLTSTGNQIVPQMNQLLGLTAVCLACLSSGFASVFFEKQLKRPSSTAAPDNDSKLLAAPMPSRKTGLWIRNIQLSLFSLAAGSLIYVLASSDTLADFLVGFTPIVYFLVGLQILGGLLAALVIQYADNIAKSFSASISIILSFAASIVLFNYKLSLGIMIGGAAVIGATWLFNISPAKPRCASPQFNDNAILGPHSPRSEYPPSRSPPRQ